MFVRELLGSLRLLAAFYNFYIAFYSVWPIVTVEKDGSLAAANYSLPIDLAALVLSHTVTGLSELLSCEIPTL